MSEKMKGKRPKNLSWLIQHLKGRKRPDMTGKNHWLWKGNSVSYRSLHKWVEKWLGKANHCERNPNHISSRYHWANISQKYIRDLSDWIQLCPKCNASDKKIERKVTKLGGI